MTETPGEQEKTLDADGCVGKTSPEPLPQTRKKTSKQSSRKSSASPNRKRPLFLYLKADGHTPALSWTNMEDGRWPTERWTQNSGEFPKDAPESTLSQILQEQVDPKYCLTAKACLGILRRADKRGKLIIPILRHALERQAEILIGGGYDGLTFCLQGSMIGRSDKNGPQGAGIKVDESFTLDTIDRHAVAYGINRLMFNAGESVKLGFEPQKELSPTIIGTGPNAVMHPLTIPEISGTLTAKMAKGTGGPAGDEMQNLVAEYPDYIVRRFTPTECGRLQGFPDWWTDELGIAQPTTGQIERWVEIFKTHWSLITSKEGVRAPKSRNQVIRWLKNPTNDSSLYKMWGNGLALPCAMFVLEGITIVSRKEMIG